MLYPEELIEEVRYSNDILDVVSEYVKLEKKGKAYFGLCPFHKEKTPSFSVTPEKQIYYCYGCGKGGNVIQFIMSSENFDFVDAVKHLADRARIQLPENESSGDIESIRLKKSLQDINLTAARYFYSVLNDNLGIIGQQYLSKREITSSTIRKFGLGFSTEEWDGLYKHLKNKGFEEGDMLKSGLILPNKKGSYYDRFRSRIMYPIFDIRGNIIGFGGRVTDSSMPKYINSPETLLYNKGKHLYGMNFAKNSPIKRLLIVEGYMDVISLHQSGIINSVASLGTAMTESQGRVLKKYSEQVIIAYDADTAGQTATMRGLGILNDIGCNVKVLQIPDGKDPDEFVRKNGVDRFRKLMDNALTLVEYKLKILKSQVDTTNTEGKIIFLNKAAAILSGIENNVEREMYIKNFSEEYNITQEAIFSEVLKRTLPRASFKSTMQVKQENSRLRNDAEDIDNRRNAHDERFLLALLVIDNTIYKFVKDKIDSNWFMDEKNRKIAGLIFTKLEENRGIVPAELLSMLDSQLASDFSSIINKECHCEDNAKAAIEKIRSVSVNRMEARQKQIFELLNNSSELTDIDVEKLKQELKELIFKIKVGKYA